MNRWFLILLLAFASCNSNTRITREKFSKVKAGMTSKEVKRILGAPDEIRPLRGSQTLYIYITKKDALTLRNAIVTIDNATDQVSSAYYENPE